MWANILADQGIHSLVKTGALASAQYVYSENLPCEIHVLASKLRKASEILEPFLKSGEPETKNTPQRSSPKEPHTSAYVLMWSWCVGILPFIAAAIFSVIKAIRRRQKSRAA
jgi:hypothetical protein